MIQTNCICLKNDRDEVLVFDPGADADQICSALKDLGGTVIAYPLTHGHYDHICALHEMIKRHPAPATLHPLDLSWAFTSEQNCMPPWYTLPSAADRPDVQPAYEEEGTERFGAFSCETLFLPGHSPGSVGFYFKEQKILIGGDVLFQGSIGRTDLPGGSYPTLKSSLRKLMTLPDDVTVIPGHGEATTIGVERRRNPFVREALAHA